MGKINIKELHLNSAGKFKAEKYHVKNTFLIFSINPVDGSRFRLKYYCRVSVKGKGLFVNEKENGFIGDVVFTYEALCLQIEQYLKNLPYDSDYYLPLLNKECFVEYIIHDYLTEIGFKSNGHNSYVLSNSNIYNFISDKISISLDGLDKISDNNKIKIYLWSGRYSWIETSCDRNVENIKESICGLIKPLLFSNSVSSFEKSEKLEDFVGIDLYLKNIDKGLNVATSENYKIELKKRLLDMAAAL